MVGVENRRGRHHERQLDQERASVKEDEIGRGRE